MWKTRIGHRLMSEIILTSYNEFIRLINKDRYEPISISCTSPWSNIYQMKSAVPDYKTMVEPFKKDEISWTEYVNRYLSFINEDAIVEETIYLLKKHENIALLCWCRNRDICHRSILTDILNDNIVYGSDIDVNLKSNELRLY